MRGMIIAMSSAKGMERLAGRRGMGRLALAAGVIGALSAAVGCGGGPEMPRVAEGIYAGPVLSVDSSGRHHVVVMEAPTPGWAITLDRDLEVREYRQAFVTVTRPNPALVHPQVIVKQNLLTSVESRYPVRVFARLLDYQSTATDGEYKLAADGAARIGPAAIPARPGLPTRPDAAKPDGAKTEPLIPPETPTQPDEPAPEIFPRQDEPASPPVPAPAPTPTPTPK